MIYKAELDNIRKIILHFRDFILLSKLFDYHGEMAKFIHMLKEFGYCKEKIDRFIEKAGQWTYWEQQIPYAIKEVGDQKEWDKNRGRCQK